MARIARLHYPGTVVHIIARIVNREFRIADEEIRIEYLRRLGRSVSRCDWDLLGYCLMSNHVHLGARAGRSRPSSLIQPVHSGFGGWLNPHQGRLGPVFADRFRTIWLAPERALHLLAYIHNNPVRAGVATRADESTWSSHRAYVGLDAAPPWLDVRLGLSLCGLSADRTGRQSFDRLVRKRSQDPRDPTLAGDGEAEARAAARKAACAPVELGSASARQDGLFFPIVLPSPASLPLHAVSPGPDEVLAVVAQCTHLGVDQLRSQQRSRAVTDARRLSLLTWTYLGLPRIQMARALGISSPAASQLLSRNPQRLNELAPIARQLAEGLRTREC